MVEIIGNSISSDASKFEVEGAHCIADRQETVSVVIPSFQRSQLVLRAVESVLKQTRKPIEVIVVLDGVDPETRALLEGLQCPVLHILEHAKNRGGNAARNTGIRFAKGDWIALLDDDDEWFPTKLEEQIALAAKSAWPNPVISSAFSKKTPRTMVQMPARPLGEGEHLSDYLFCRSGLFHGEGIILTSTILAPKVLFLREPMDETMHRIHETDWLLRVFTYEDVGCEFVMSPQLIWHADENRERATLRTEADWVEILEWAKDNQSLFSRKAYAAFVASILSDMASVDKRFSVFVAVLKELFGYGRPKVRDLAIFFYIWIFPRHFRPAFRDKVYCWLKGMKGALKDDD